MRVGGNPFKTVFVERYIADALSEIPLNWPLRMYHRQYGSFMEPNSPKAGFSASEIPLVLENGEPSEAKPIPSLTKSIAWSRHWADQIVSGKLGTMDGLAKSAGVSKIHARRMLRCAALSPALTTQILDGRQPVELTFDKLTRNIS